MPIYEYRCESCGETLEKLQKISDAPLVDCPACGQSALKKLVSASSFRLKGGGWYETDFKKDSRKNIAGEKDDAKSGSAGTDTSGESGKESGKSASNGDKGTSAGNSDKKQTGAASNKDSSKSTGKKSSD